MDSKTIIRLTALILGILLTPSIASSQSNWQSEINKDLVEIKDGQYISEENMLVKFEGNSLQVQFSAEGSIEHISRDQFVAFYHTYGTIFLLAMFEEAGSSISELDIQSLDELIGDPDITIKFIMAKNGVQVQFITSEGTEKMTMTWEELYQ